MIHSCLGSVISLKSQISSPSAKLADVVECLSQQQPSIESNAANSLALVDLATSSLMHFIAQPVFISMGINKFIYFRMNQSRSVKDKS